jgi:hypothetical protein
MVINKYITILYMYKKLKRSLNRVRKETTNQAKNTGRTVANDQKMAIRKVAVNAINDAIRTNKRPTQTALNTGIRQVSRPVRSTIKRDSRNVRSKIRKAGIRF